MIIILEMMASDDIVERVANKVNGLVHSCGRIMHVSSINGRFHSVHVELGLVDHDWPSKSTRKTFVVERIDRFDVFLFLKGDCWHMVL